MEKSKVNAFLMANSKYFPEESLFFIHQFLLETDNNRGLMLQFTQFNDPLIMLVISFLFGGLGIDRFIIGDKVLGVLKLLTCGGAGIWALVDLFLIMGATKKNNLKKLTSKVALGFY